MRHKFRQVNIVGLTWVEVLATLTILGFLLSLGVPSWRALQTQQAERRLLNDVERVLVFARNQAFLRAETLQLHPRVASDGWGSGMVLVLKKTSDGHSELLHTWHWHYPGMHLTWHGFLGEDAIVIAHTPAKLAMNGHFVFDKQNTSPKQWVVNRFGKIRIQSPKL